MSGEGEPYEKQCLSRGRDVRRPRGVRGLGDRERRAPSSSSPWATRDAYCPSALALLGLLDFSNDVLDLFINRPIAIDIDVDAGYALPSMDGDDLVGGRSKSGCRRTG
jgi:hypothetical protein